MPVRKRQEVQEVLRGAEIGSAPIARREDDPVRAELETPIESLETRIAEMRVYL